MSFWRFDPQTPPPVGANKDEAITVLTTQDDQTPTPGVELSSPGMGVSHLTKDKEQELETLTRSWYVEMLVGAFCLFLAGHVRVFKVVISLLTLRHLSNPTVLARLAFPFLSPLQRIFQSPMD